MKISFQSRKSYLVVCSVTVTIPLFLSRYIFVISTRSHSCAILSNWLVLFVPSLLITFVPSWELSSPMFMIHLDVHFVLEGATPRNHELCVHLELYRLWTHCHPNIGTWPHVHCPSIVCIAIEPKFIIYTVALHTPSYPWQLLLETVWFYF